jgi:aminomethyltransferase
MSERSFVMKKTVLHDRHVALDAKMVDFAGWHMPLQYTSIKEEHDAVRTRAGIFDVSHMGEIEITGDKAEAFVDYLFTNDVKSMHKNQVLYGMMCYKHGGVVDDLLVYKYSDTRYLLVVNASNIDKDLAWIIDNNTFGVEITNLSDDMSEVAVQGPLAETILQKTTNYDLKNISFFTFDDIMIYNQNVMVSRTGYTGEDGFEIYGSHEAIDAIFTALLKDHDDLSPCGLGCRDTLRFEVALPLYGNELSKDITPLEAGLGFAVKLDAGDFIGKDVLVAQKANRPKRRLVGLEVLDKGIARHGYDVYKDNNQVGEITTGYISPSTGESVALALIDVPYHKKETELTVKVRKRTMKVKVRNKKFYNKNYNK